MNPIDQLRLFVIAVQFYTRIPVVGGLAHWSRYSSARLALATRYFPLVGLLLGLIIAMVYVVMALLFPHPVAVIISLIAGVLLTGAFHEDGWADFCDGFGGTASRERTLEIMTDSRIGAYGAIGCTLLLLLKFEVLASIDSQWTALMFICAHPFSRACAVVVMMILPYARPDDESKAKPVAESVRRLDLLIAILIGLSPIIGAVIWLNEYEAFLLPVLLAMTTTIWMVRRFFRRLQGYTGDCLGATQQLSETMFYLGLLCWLTIYQTVMESASS